MGNVNTGNRGKKGDWKVYKQRITLSLSNSAIERLRSLEKNSKKMGISGANKSSIIQALIINTKGREELINDRRRKIAIKISKLNRILQDLNEEHEQILSEKSMQTIPLSIIIKEEKEDDDDE